MSKVKIINGISYEDDNFVCEFQLSNKHDYNDLCIIRDKIRKKEYGCSYYKKESLNSWLNQYGFELEDEVCIETIGSNNNNSNYKGNNNDKYIMKTLKKL